MTHREGEPADIGKLITKLAEVMAEATHVEKRGRNDFHKYDYATEADVLAAVRNGLSSRNVIIMPAIPASNVVEISTKQGHSYRTDVTMIYTAFDGDTGASISVPWAGTGSDASDKGLYKAITGANKYFMLKLFLLPTGDDPEASEAGEVKRTSSPKASAAPAPSSAAQGSQQVPKPAPGPSGTQPASDSQKRKIWAENHKHGLNDEDLHFIIKRMYGHESINDILKTQVDDVLTNILAYKEWKAKQAPEGDAA